MIKKYNEFIKESVNDENIENINIKDVENNHSFTDNNGIFHKNGYAIISTKGTSGRFNALRKLLIQLINIRGVHCDLNDVDVSNIEDMGTLFSKYDKTMGEFDGDISGWEVGKVYNFSRMFFGSKYTGEYGGISKWGVGGGIDFSYMFANSEFDGDISDWKISSSNVTIDLDCMFKNSKFTGKNGDLNKWKIKVDKYCTLRKYEVFYGCNLQIDEPKFDR